MKRHGKLMVVCSTSLLWGCTQLSALLAPPDSSAVASRGRSAPVQRPEATRLSTGAVVDQERLFAQGREAQARGDLRRAEALYGQLLALSPRHVGALNGAGIILAQTGRLEAAVAHFGRALAIEPQAAHLHNNLGYALLLAGRLTEAESTLQRARALNPANALTDKNLALLAQAQERAAAAAAAKAPAPSGQTLVAVAPSVYELRDPAPMPAAREAAAATSVRASAGTAVSAAPAARAPAAAPVQLPARPLAQALAPRNPATLRGVRLEVSNGVGIRHMARRTAERLSATGLVAARLTNQPGYRQVKTEIQFAPGQMAAAEALSGQLPLAPTLTQVKPMERNIQVRLVLGRDLAGQAIAAWIDGEAEETSRLVTLNAREGWLWS